MHVCSVWLFHANMFWFVCDTKYRNYDYCSFYVDTPAEPDRETWSKLIDNLDTNNGLIEYLKSKQILSAEKCNEFDRESNWRSYQEQNRSLLKIIFANDKNNSDMEMFTEALKETGQEHIAKYIQRRRMGNFSTSIEFDNNRSTGTYNLPSIFFHHTASALSYPLDLLFRTLMETRSLPSEWGLSIITPKYKKGSPSDPTNYRPIALTCCCCKILESIIADDMLTFLSEHNLITRSQHGFLKRHSTSTNLLESINDWTLTISNHKSVTIAYLDFKSAFDCISHTKLIHKLCSYGIQGNLLFWIKAFLSGRTQMVRINSSLSQICTVTSGVPQGSCLGPLLFNLFINDVTDHLTTPINAKLSSRLNLTTFINGLELGK